MKGAKRDMDFILMVFMKKISFGANGPFWPKDGMPSKLWIRAIDFFEILHNERGQEIHEN